VAIGGLHGSGAESCLLSHGLNLGRERRNLDIYIGRERNREVVESGTLAGGDPLRSTKGTLRRRCNIKLEKNLGWL
jgi:hypothetical protein